jgi:Replication initiator protein, pSAM2
VIRLDRAMPNYRASELRPPDGRFGVELLEHAIRTTVDGVSAPLPDELGGGRVQWGSERDIRPLDHGQVRGEIAGYLAKYATKSTEQAGGVLHRVTEHQLDALPVREPSGATCARRSRSPVTGRSPTGASVSARTSSATAATA